ncbi:MAG TPA: SPASM domain-containing protein, partial [Anaerolineae bacterium]|nr:SPASM domain-containing protein [Anaerolineae bacterium]
EANLRLYLDWEPSANPECGECRLLPICMGGCPHLRLRHSGQADCATWRYVLGETLGIRHKLEEMSRSLGEPVEQGSLATVQ